ncbi:MAG: enoyl-CoA hydratase/isomerase family protein [Deltaproteobacteria bacterium]|nr:enoyl-CoA hydratase/isomerase family protein [Deltaproteobacteria bacterium]
MAYQTIKFEVVETGIGLLTLDREKCLNAINLKMLDELYLLFRSLDERPEVRVLVMTGAGRGFCSGADLKDEGFSSEEGLQAFSSASVHLEVIQKKYSGIIKEMRRISQPIIAAVKGPAAGGGMSLALAADIIIACPGAKFTASFINIGLSGGELGTTYFLPRLVGPARASEILMTGRSVDAEEAERIGMISRLVPENELLESSLETARRMVGKTPLGLRLTKETIRQNLDAPSLENAIEMENRNQSILCAAPEFFEAVALFNKKT